eukprot:gene31697-34954_t
MKWLLGDRDEAAWADTCAVSLALPILAASPAHVDASAEILSEDDHRADKIRDDIDRCLRAAD